MGSAPARDIAIQIIRTLRDAGHVAYLAGGCVRDELLGQQPKDYDIATDAHPDRVGRLFRRTREVGKSFGVMLVSLGGVTVEVSTFRREHGYSDKRRPDAVEFCDAQSDSQRRDFTINALYIDPLDMSESGCGRVIDFVGGLHDLRAGVVRAVGDPERRLAEDHLRALRAARFASRLGFVIEDATAAAIVRHARELQGVSRERIGDEIRRMATHRNRAAAFGLIERLSLDGPALLEPSRGTGGQFPVTHSLGSQGVGVGLALAAWAVDRMELSDGAGVAAAASETAGRWRRALCLSNDETTAMRLTMEGVGLIEAKWDSLGVAGRKRAGGSPWFAGALALVRGRHAAIASGVEQDIRALAEEPGGLRPRPLVSGDDLIRAGLLPGPAFGEWLERAYDAQLEGRVTTRAGALEMVLEWAGRSMGG